MSNSCHYCKKLIVDEESMVIDNPYKYTYSLDPIDFICEKCEAKFRAKSCASTINCEMVNYKNMAEKGGVFSRVEYMGSILEQIRNYWIKFYTENVEDKYHFWKDEFENEVIKSTNLTREGGDVNVSN